MEDVRYLLALGDEANRISIAPGVSVVRRLRDIVVVEAKRSHALLLAEERDYVRVYRSSAEALLALSVFERAEDQADISPAVSTTRSKGP